MFDSIVQTIADYPYLGVVLFFLICGLGAPLPEELVLIAGGYICAKFPDKAQVGWMMAWCGASILAFDLLPFVLGRVFGARIMRLRFLRFTFTRKRLAQFDRWFRRRGDLVIFLARFLAGIRVIAFFTAGTMKMRWSRFLLLDGLGIAIIVPLMVWLGYSGAGVIDEVIAQVQAVERGILWLVGGGTLLAVLWFGFWRRRRRRRSYRGPRETYIEPRLPVQKVDSTEQQAEPAGAADRSAASAPATPDNPGASAAETGAEDASDPQDSASTSDPPARRPGDSDPAS